MQEAEAIYLAGQKRFPKFILFYMNLADLYRAMNLEEKSKEYIDKGLQFEPNNADLHYALGLWYIRQKDHAKGIEELKKALSLAPSNASIVYGYAVALFSTGKANESIQLLEKFITAHGNNATILDGLVSICQDQKLSDKANKYGIIRKKVFGY